MRLPWPLRLGVAAVSPPCYLCFVFQFFPFVAGSFVTLYTHTEREKEKIEDKMPNGAAALAKYMDDPGRLWLDLQSYHGSRDDPAGGYRYQLVRLCDRVAFFFLFSFALFFLFLLPLSLSSYSLALLYRSLI